MKRKTVLFLSVLAIVLAVTAFAVGNAYATTGCFNDTNGHWAETFICWMNDKGITGGYPDGGYHPNSSVTRAEMAVFMKAQAEVPPSTGDVYFTFGPNEWQPNAAYNGYIEYFTIFNHLRSAATGTQLFQATPVLPSGLYNTVMYIKGVQICYIATGGGYLDTVTVEHFKTYDDGTTSTLNSVTDTTDRTDTMCRQYYFTFPSSFYGDNHLTIEIYHHFNSTADYLYVSSTSVILEPSEYTGPHISAPQPDSYAPLAIPQGLETGRP
jgi:hypothetical protein